VALSLLFTVLGKDDLKNTVVRLVKLRNPWGFGEWEGKNVRTVEM
jgi:hypothetical protein